jgi:hypothetical protein
MELGNYIHDYLARAAADPQDDLLDALAIACNASGFDQITAQIMMVIPFGACGESTGSLLGNSMRILATRPDRQQQVRDTPDLLMPFIEEALRFEPPFRGHYRHVVADTTLGGMDLPAGSRLLLLWGRRTEIRPNVGGLRDDRSCSHPAPSPSLAEEQITNTAACPRHRSPLTVNPRTPATRLTASSPGCSRTACRARVVRSVCESYLLTLPHNMGAKYRVGLPSFSIWSCAPR